MSFLKNKMTVAIVILSFGFLISIGYGLKQENKSALQNGVGTVLNGVQGTVYNSTDQIKDFFYLILNFSEVKQEYANMENENAELEQKAANYDALLEKNTILQEQLNYKDRNSQFSYVGANIINRTGNGLVESYTLDKGSNDGISKGSIVITHLGLVGQITSVGSNSSTVQTLGDENIAVAAMIENSVQNNGIVKGFKDKSSQQLVKMYSLPLDSVVKVGDVITTSDNEFVYPKGIRIGTVIEVEEDKAKVMKNAVVQPFVDLETIEELLIIVPKEQ